MVDPIFALSQGALIANILNPMMASEDGERENMTAYAVSPQAVTGVRYSYWSGFDNAPEDSVAIIRLRGALMKEDQSCGPIGMETVGQILREADSHRNISAIVLHVDSPGGTVDGTETLANIVKNSQKPIVTFVDGQMCSAALWIGTSSKETIASTDTDEIGSVGVLMQFADMQPYWEKQGIKFHMVTASTSPDKVAMWEELRAGKYESYIKEILDPLDEKFMNTIRENCPNATDEHLTGKVFFARDVMGVFVDSIGTLEDAILRASKLAPAKDEITNPKNKVKRSMKQFTKLNAVLGLESLESVEESVSLNEEQLDLVETALSEPDTISAERDSAITERDTVILERDAARTELTNALNSINAIDPTILGAETPEGKATAIRALLSSKPGAAPIGNLGSTDPIKDTVDWEAIDNLPHNKAVDNNL